MDRRVFITLAARLTLATAISVVVQPLFQSVAVGPAEAHCPGDTNPTGNIGVTGSQTISGSGVTAVRANVEWTVPNPCFPGFPYGRDEPAAGQFRNWTDGSH